MNGFLRLGTALAAVSIVLGGRIAIADDSLIYEQLADAIVFNPEPDFKPANATLNAGQLSCPSIKATGLSMACAAHLVSTQNTTEEGMTACENYEKNIGCFKTTAPEPVK